MLRHPAIVDTKRYRVRRDFQFEFFTRHAGLRPEHHFLDLGCGSQLRGGSRLIPYLERGNYVGVDVRADAIAEANEWVDALGLRSKAPSLHHVEDLSSCALAGRFDFIQSFAVLFHLDDANLDAWFAFVRRHLAVGGHCFANVNIGHRREANRRWNGFPNIWRPFEEYRVRAQAAGLSCLRLHRLAVYGHRLSKADDDQVMIHVY